jgi:hypothetical protein
VNWERAPPSAPGPAQSEPPSTMSLFPVDVSTMPITIMWICGSYYANDTFISGSVRMDN